MKPTIEYGYNWNIKDGQCLWDTTNDAGKLSEKWRFHTRNTYLNKIIQNYDKPCDVIMINHAM